MSDEDSPIDQAVDSAKAVFGCGLQTIGILVGVILLFGVVFAVGLWIFGFFT